MWSTNEIAKALGIKYKRLDAWVRHTVVSPEDPGRGTGSRRRYTFADVVAVEAAQTLRSAGMSLGFIADFARAIQGEALEITESLPPTVVASNGTQVLVRRGEVVSGELFNSGEPVVALRLDQLSETARRKLRPNRRFKIRMRKR